MSELFPTKTISIEVVGCTEPSREYEFNRWYNKVHVPYLRAIPGILDVYRYRDMLPDFGDLRNPRFEAKEGMPVRYLTLYRISSDDPWGLMQKVKQDDEKRASEGKMLDCFKSYELTVWDFRAYRRTVSPLQRPYSNLPDGMPEAILLVFSSANPARKDEYYDWWSYTHSHDLLETPGLVQAEQFLTLNPKPAENEVTLLNFYEIDSDDPAAVVKKILWTDKNMRGPQGRMTNAWQRSDCCSSGLYQHFDI